MDVSINYRCGSIVAEVELPETISEDTATEFAEDVNTTSIAVPNSTISSIPGGVTVSTASSQGSSGGGSNDGNQTTIAIVVVVVCVVLTAIAIAIVVRKKRTSARNPAPPPRHSQRPGNMIVNPAVKTNPAYDDTAADTAAFA